MKRRVLFSFLIIAMAMAAITGGTLAWFTDSAELSDNVFQAGTVDIAAGQTTPGDPIDIDNWAPGATEEITFTVTNNGSLDIFVRAEIQGQWDFDPAEDFDFVNITVAGEWTEIDGYYYYNGDIEFVEDEITLVVTLEFDTQAGNDFQEQVYTLSTTFEAIQADHGAAAAEWGVEWEDGSWD